MIPLVSPTITEHDQKHLARSAYNGLLTGEREVGTFERNFAERVGAQHAVAVNSGTSALVVALYALGVSEGFEVTIPSWSCVALRNAVESVGGEIVYADTHWSVSDAAALVPYCDPDFVVLSHMFGQQTSFGFKVQVEDWTLSLGAAITLQADLGVCSTHASKMISTGRGGVIFGNDETLMQRIRELVHYDTHTRFGFSLGMSAMQAALGNSQLAQLDAFIERRRELAARYTTAFRAAGIDCPGDDTGSVFFRYLVSVKDPAAMVMLIASLGIEAGRGVYPALHQLDNRPDDDYPGTTHSVNTLLSVPVHPSITDTQAEQIIEAILGVCAP